MDLSNLNIKNLDHLGLVAGLCQEVGIAEIIDKLIPSSANDKIISTGKCLEAMILNGLGFTGRTLHMYSQYFEDKPIQRLALTTKKIINKIENNRDNSDPENSDHPIARKITPLYIGWRTMP